MPIGSVTSAPSSKTITLEDISKIKDGPTRERYLRVYEKRQAGETSNPAPSKKSSKVSRFFGSILKTNSSSNKAKVSEPSKAEIDAKIMITPSFSAQIGSNGSFLNQTSSFAIHKGPTKKDIQVAEHEALEACLTELKETRNHILTSLSKDQQLQMSKHLAEINVRIADLEKRIS